VKLYRLDTECPACGHRPYLRYTDLMLEAVAGMKPSAVLFHWTCASETSRRGSERPCGERFPIRAAAVQRGQHVDNARFAEDAPPESPLSPRQAEVCALVAEGHADKRIAAMLGIGKPTVRVHVRDAARRLCDMDGTVCRVFPRRTIEAFYRQQAKSPGPERVFPTL
jgi:DNA-binding CsgD family transcriptional regulator